MIRRWHRPREIPFSLDSFLDLVANVIGVIIRLILVAWVGARSYSSLMTLHPPEPHASEPSSVNEPASPLQAELARQRQEMEASQTRLLDQACRLEQVKTGNDQLAHDLTVLAGSGTNLDQERAALNRALDDKGRTAGHLDVSLQQLRQRAQRLASELRALEQQPAATKTLHYRTPVSRPVQAEEMLFECRAGRVSFIDIAALLQEIRDSIQDQADELRRNWLVERTAGPIGPFRLRYKVERERGLLDGFGGAGAPDPDARFRYGVSGWVLEPLAEIRGEPLDAALRPGSAFRQVVDTLQPHQAVVTFAVYPDSFALYRGLRDYLHERQVEVAGRPIPQGLPISGSPQGSASRGQ